MPVKLLSIKGVLLLATFFATSHLSYANHYVVNTYKANIIDTPITTKLLPLTKYLVGHIRYPQQARENNITGWVVAILYVNNNGMFTDAKILRGIANGCDEEVRNTIMEFKQKMPTLTPGEYLLPVYFGPRENKPLLSEDIRNKPNCLLEITVTTV